MNWTEATSLLKEYNPTYGQIDSNELWKLNLLFAMYVKQIIIIITHTATNRGWCLTLNEYWWIFKSLNWIVHIILLILGEIWSKGSNLTSLLLVDVFVNIKSYQDRQKDCQGSAKANCIFIITSAFYLPRQKMLKFEGCSLTCILPYTGKLIQITKPKTFCGIRE